MFPNQLTSQPFINFQTTCYLRHAITLFNQWHRIILNFFVLYLYFFVVVDLVFIRPFQYEVYRNPNKYLRPTKSTN